MLLTPLPLSQTVTPSRTPSPLSVTYFMDGPYWRLEESLPTQSRLLMYLCFYTVLVKEVLNSGATSNLSWECSNFRGKVSSVPLPFPDLPYPTTLCV